MARGEARLGPLAVLWDVPDDAPGAAGGLEYLAPGDGAPATWRIRDGEIGAPPEPYDAFYGPVRVRVEGDDVRVWSPSADLLVAPTRVEGIASGPAALPASIALHALAAHAGLAHLHAAVVRVDGAVIVCPGGSGSGKTSLALAAGELLADDAAYVDRDLVVWPVRRAPHASPATARAHPGLEVLGPVTEGLLEKVRLRGDDGPAAPARIDRVLLPAIDRSARTHVEEASGADAFPVLIGASALAPIELAPRREELLDLLARVAEIPVAILIAGPDALEDPGVIARAIAAWVSRG